MSDSQSLGKGIGRHLEVRGSSVVSPHLPPTSLFYRTVYLLLSSSLHHRLNFSALDTEHKILSFSITLRDLGVSPLSLMKTAFACVGKFLQHGHVATNARTIISCRLDTAP